MCEKERATVSWPLNPGRRDCHVAQQRLSQTSHEALQHKALSHGVEVSVIVQDLSEVPGSMQ